MQGDSPAFHLSFNHASIEVYTVGSGFWLINIIETESLFRGQSVKDIDVLKQQFEAYVSIHKHDLAGKNFDVTKRVIFTDIGLDHCLMLTFSQDYNHVLCYISAMFLSVHKSVSFNAEGMFHIFC